MDVNSAQEWDGADVEVPAVLPIPTSLAKPEDNLCDTCRALNLTPRKFIVLPEDPEVKEGPKPDDLTIELGHVEDIKKKSHCPLCRLILTALGSGLPSAEDGQSVFVKMSWNTDGPIEDPNTPWITTPQIRVLKPYAQKGVDQFVTWPGFNLFPEITLLANDAPASSKKTSFVRIINDKIDFRMVRNWLTACKVWHGDICDQSEMLGDEVEDPSIEIPHFRLIDVINNCVVPAPRGPKYIALSYVWGQLDSESTLQLFESNAAELAEPDALSHPQNYQRIPTTIRDAMQVVRELGFRYLWVDTLCILQDDIRGSRSGAIEKMDLVFGAAYLTIMAATGIDANAGLPGLRAGTRGINQPIEAIFPDMRLGFKQRIQNYIKDSVYYTRAWPYQEQRFSKRSLVFIGGQVVYRCSEIDEWREDVFFEDLPSHPSRPSSRRKSSDIGAYEGLIQTYSGLSLTYDTDIYNAFGGLTRYFKRSLKVNLCHGIPDAYFDWFLLWIPLVLQTRRRITPSWSWSGWFGQSWPNIWDWYSRSISKVNNALRQRTWIIWYQRKAHDSEECIRVYTPEDVSPDTISTNFYGGPVKARFPFDCSRVTPTPRKLTSAPSYLEDSFNPSPGSGFLQFWTVSVILKLDKSITEDSSHGPSNANIPLGIFGLDLSRQLGTVFVNPDWADINVNRNLPNEHEFILLCEGRDKRADRRKEDEEDGWKYKLMLIEWHPDGDGQPEWAERVGLGSIDKGDVDQALAGGPVWKEIILG